jgi:steroid 5-alpha reductase family enzyme
MIALVLPLSFAAVLLAMAVTFAIGVKVGKHSVIDTTWGLGFALVALVSATVGDGDADRRWLASGLVIVWGVRLGIHIGLRNRGHAEDPRYEAMFAKVKAEGRSVNLHALWRVYGIQAVLLWFISLPVQVNATMDEGLGAFAWVGTAIWVVGFAFEAVGDLQLTRFKADPANQGQVMDSGLWRYTRHPNYFGDATMWWGIFLISAEHTPGCYFFLSPLVMNFFLTNVSGKKLLEKGMATTRPGYAEYIKRTSGFFPLPPKKGAV